MVKEFLHGHVTSDVDLIENEQILIDKYNLSLNLILSTKAQRAEYDKQYTNAVRLWIDAKQWRRAHDIYCSYVFHDTLLKGLYFFNYIFLMIFNFFLGDFEFAKNILDVLDHQRANIAHWNRRGGFTRQYIDLLISFEKIRHGQVSLDCKRETADFKRLRKTSRIGICKTTYF